MKIILLIALLITSFNITAQTFDVSLVTEVKKVSVFNKVTGQKFSAIFGDSAELPIGKMQPWIDKQLAKKSWGEKESDLEITITDLTSQFDEEQSAIAARKLEIEEIKQTISLIDTTDKPAWEKRLLKRLVKEMKE